jgi:multiple sugar transport system substrate-binding protein/putative aldouronate transport system substrate-binding protein
MLLDWNQDDLLADCGPYIKENMKKALEKNAGLSPDGKVYGYGFSVASNPEDHASTIYHPDARYDLYKLLDYPKILTLEDWIDVLAQMKEICPTSDAGKEAYGVSLFSDWDGNMVMFVKSTAALYGYEEFGIGLYDAENQIWQDCLADDSIYLRCLKFYNRLYQKGLLDPDSMTQGVDEAGEDYAAGGAFFNIFNYCGSMQYNTPEHMNAGKAMYPVIMEDQKTLMTGLNVFGGNRIITIGADTQYPELCMEIINWLSTPEGTMVTNYGPQGITWDYDENKKPYFTDLGLKTITDARSTEMTGGYTGIYKDGVNAMNFSTWNIDASNPDSNGESYNYQSWASYNAALSYDILDDWRKYTGFTTFDEYIDSRPHAVAVGTKFTEDKRSTELELQWQQVSQAICDYSWQAIYAENEVEYDKLVQEMKDITAGYGYEDVADFYRSQAVKRKAAEDAVRN